MTTLTGIKDAQYLAQFLGKKIAIRITADKKNIYHIYPKMTAIYEWNQVDVEDSRGLRYRFSWKDCENPYVVLQENVEIVIK